MKDYNKANIPLARELRKNMTLWERKLWYEFLREYPVKFQRQKVIGNYIADFYCAKAKLIIELDGKGHDLEENALKDIKRTAELEKLDIRVLRILNTQLSRNFKSVCEMIDVEVNKSLPDNLKFLDLI